MPIFSKVGVLFDLKPWQWNSTSICNE